MPFGRRGVRWIAAACVALAMSAPVAGCSKDGSDNKDSAQSTEGSAKPKTPTTGTNGLQPTLGDYIKQNDITETQAAPGQAGAPEINLPILPGWKNVGQAKPPYAYAAIVDTQPSFAADPPSIVAVLAKLTGPADPAQILALAPNEIKNLPDFQGTDPRQGKLANFDSTEISGTYVRSGKTRLIAQKTVVIPGTGALFVLQLNADGLREQAASLMQATSAIDSKATIKP